MASRILELLQKDGSVASIRIGLGMPEQLPGEGRTWQCTVYVEGPGRNVARPIYGDDALQALVLALVVLRANVSSLKAEYGTNLTYENVGDLWLDLGHG
jgi:hypothetical protein